MSDKYLFDSIVEEFGRELRQEKIYPFVNDNLNSKLVLRDYQQQALNRFYAYYETDNVEAYIKPSNNAHIAYHMATGSGKTVIMAGLILYLYEQGYRHFLFFVNRGQIVEKTKDNFINPHANKYLFNDKITINNKQIEIKAVDNFAYANKDAINICFTTIQGLFSDFHQEKENALTLEDFKDKKIALIADEAHHLSASTRNTQQDLLKASWENTVEKIFKANKDNILLEFSATIELNHQEVKKKYLDKIIYQYDLRHFVADGFSKKIDLLKSDTTQKDRILQALITSIYRKQVAIKHKLNIKPVILFKSSKISESKTNQADFHQQIANLSPDDLQIIKQQTNIEVLKNAFAFFETQGLSFNALCEHIKNSFALKYCLCTNNNNELEANQKKLNNLEDKNNTVRAIFSVDKLNEGWDVLNLFDIVRMYEGQARGGTQQGRISKKTTQEAQLIGRGARYCPFTINQDDEAYKRKFDNDITNELRVLEELYFHSSNESQYIAEIKQALTEQGLMDEKEPIKLPLKIKPNIDLNGKVVFKNKSAIKSYDKVKNLSDFGIAKKNFAYNLSTGKGTLVDIFSDDNNTDEKIQIKELNFVNFIGVNIIKNAMLVFDTFTFSYLKTYLPHIKTINEFIAHKDYLAQFKITISGDYQNLSNKEKLTIALAFFNIFEGELKNNIVKRKGTVEFYANDAKSIFKEKTLLIPVDNHKKIQTVPDEWFIFTEFYGTSEEHALIDLIRVLITDIQAQYGDVYLIRNERHFKIYNFADGRAFEPDFVLLAKNNNNINYQIFIEPKGEYLVKTDQWKEDFLLAIKDKCKLPVFENTTQNYHIIGLPFYNQSNENDFNSALKQAMSLNE